MASSNSPSGTENPSAPADVLSSTKAQILTCLKYFKVPSGSNVDWSVGSIDASEENERAKKENEELQKLIDELIQKTSDLIKLIENNHCALWLGVDGYIVEIKKRVSIACAYESMRAIASKDEDGAYEKCYPIFKPFRDASKTAKDICRILDKARIVSPIGMVLRFYPEGVPIPKRGKVPEETDAPPAKMSSETLMKRAYGVEQPKNNKKDSGQPEKQLLGDKLPIVAKPSSKATSSTQTQRNEAPEDPPGTESAEKDEVLTPTLEQLPITESTANPPLVAPNTEPETEEVEDEAENGGDGLGPAPTQSVDSTITRMVDMDRGSDQFVERLRQIENEDFMKGQLLPITYNDSVEFVEALKDKKLNDVSLINELDDAFNKNTVKCSLDKIYSFNSLRTSKTVKNNASKDVVRTIKYLMNDENKGFHLIMKESTKKFPFQAPEFVQKISVHSSIEKNCESAEMGKLKNAQNFLIFALKDSLIDISSEMNTTANYYYLHKGEMVLFVCQPTENDLEMYRDWIVKDPKEEWIVGKLEGGFRQLKIQEGQTVVVPSCFLHFIFFPVKSTVLGGSFITVSRLKESMRLTGLLEKNNGSKDNKIISYLTNYWSSLFFFAKDCLEEADDETKAIGREVTLALEEPQNQKFISKCLPAQPKKNRTPKKSVIAGAVEDPSDDQDDGNGTDESEEF